MGELTQAAARKAFSTFDGLAPPIVKRVETSPADIKSAEAVLRRLDLPIIAPDAVNTAIAQRIGAMMTTFDAKMAASAWMVGIEVTPA
jgi:uncharacterized protein